MITMINTKHTSTCNVTKTNDTRQPTAIKPIATSSDIAHFIHDGISNSRNCVLKLAQPDQ
jgi:hypothetical protein